MAKLKTMIIYAASTSLASIRSDVEPARERGQPVRLVAIEEFRGETEQNAGAVYVERTDGDELLFDKIQQAYPLIEVADWTGSVNLDKFESFAPKPAEDDLVELRLQLIRLGGSAPAGADAGELANLIAAQRAAQRHVPILPNPQTQGTTIPDPTPVVQKADGDKLIDSRAVGSTAPMLAAAEAVAGEGVTGTQSAGQSAPLQVEQNAADNAAEGQAQPTAQDVARAAADAAKGSGSTATGTTSTTAKPAGAKPTGSKPAASKPAASKPAKAS